jgi:hypothetical protein
MGNLTHFGDNCCGNSSNPYIYVKQYDTQGVTNKLAWFFNLRQFRQKENRQDERIFKLKRIFHCVKRFFFSDKTSLKEYIEIKSFFRKKNSLYALKYAYFTHKKSFFRYVFGHVISYTMLASFYTVAIWRIRKNSCLNFSNTLLHFFFFFFFIMLLHVTLGSAYMIKEKWRCLSRSKISNAKRYTLCHQYYSE